jgi:hypothetical protein
MDPGFLRPKIEKNLQLYQKKFFDQKLQFSYPWASIKDVTKEAFSSQKRKSSTLKHEISQFFLLFWVTFALLDSNPDPDSEYGSGSTDLIESKSNPDPDPKPCW